MIRSTPCRHVALELPLFGGDGRCYECGARLDVRPCGCATPPVGAGRANAPGAAVGGDEAAQRQGDGPEDGDELGRLRERVAALEEALAVLGREPAGLSAGAVLARHR